MGGWGEGEVGEGVKAVRGRSVDYIRRHMYDFFLQLLRFLLFPSAFLGYIWILSRVREL